MKAPPNILYIVCHDLGRHLGAYGVPVSSPNLDRFAQSGVTFHQAFCSSPCCSPSRGCALTGMYAHRNGLMGLVNRGWSLPESSKTIVQYLNEQGYETAHAGLQHERYSAMANSYQKLLGPTGTDQDEFAEAAVDQAIAYLQQRDGGKPFYLNVGTAEVHSVHWQGKFRGGERLKKYEERVGERGSAVLPSFAPDTPEIRREMEKLESSIAFLDQELQRLLDAVEELGLRESTLIVFTTDHGLPGMRGKTTLYDMGVETALMMSMPGTLKAGTHCDHLIPNIDLLPTLLDAAQLPLPEDIDGRSFWPWLQGEAYEPNPCIFTESNYHSGYDPIRSIRTPEYHFIRNFDPDAREQWLPDEVPSMNQSYSSWYTQLWPVPEKPRASCELFDLKADPHEFNNVAEHPAFQEIREQLDRDLLSWMQETEDPLLNGPIPDQLHGWPEAVT